MKYEREGWRRRGVLMVHRWFPDRELMLRTEGRLTFVRVSRTTQICMTTGLILFGAWLAFGTVRFVQHEKIMAAKEDQITDARLAYRSLLVDVADYQSKYSAITGDLVENHALMMGLLEKNTTLQQNLISVKSRLKLTEEERQSIISTRENLKKEMLGIEKKMGLLANHNFSLKGNLDTVSLALQTAMAERNQARYESAGMRRKVKKLEIHLAELNEAELKTVKRLTERTADYIETMGKVVQLTGLKTDQLLPNRAQLPKGQGGPFIAVKDDELPGAQLKANLEILESQLELSGALQEIMGRLPLSAPLSSYYLTSKYGKRRDPVNKKWGMHYGLDMGSPFKSSVYTTAPGRVVFAGWKGRYGKLVVIDHGSGLKTRYGHLNKITVKKGQVVRFRDKIGLLGSTGRSTGPHLHYEIMFRGKSKNPSKFIKAGKYVFQG